MMPTFLIPPAIVVVVAIVGGLLRYRIHVKVTGRQNLGHGPMIAIGGDVIPMEKYDQFAWAATNQSLQGAVYVRVYGAVGEGTDGLERRVEANYSPEPIRLERNQGHRWETSFAGLAAQGIDLERGVRGFVEIDGRDKPFQSRKLLPRPGGSRTTPRPTPLTRPRE